ncbi:hypothetical protein [Bifidobacterium gallicum]|uniref:Uncharacterized protein n=1 Tax=Bifidobacterium gallicum DSM 20093 = LMG 11596 TaxID=561180 RepID=D1NTG0_9BIFI|nr:hypothetical protein [Bifidobacterium gallicum]EFA23014.1 hypothetical protein BIFGAL_03118 [Bifidobacterium gallicum DSM 20093 = LMG 11596]KFI57674.1 hypothetical protein BGLCM_1364 [Bifidobacterium gallicum DSM 20093 = LMG 11596]
MAVVTFTEADYTRFRAMLRFFVQQADADEQQGHVDQPAVYPDDNGEFCKHYDVQPDLFMYPGNLNYGVHLSLRGKFGTSASTYMNIWDTWIVIEPVFTGEGKDRRVTALRTGLKADAGFATTEELPSPDELTFTLDQLDLNGAMEQLPNEHVKQMLDLDWQLLRLHLQHKIERRKEEQLNEADRF